MSDVLVRLEDAECDYFAGKVMSILVECNPKEGTHCEKATLVGEKNEEVLILPSFSAGDSSTIQGSVISCT
ncbi:MAG: hypothetical protein J7M09_02950 [Deltaproteobacteria bacterium]|nr:hypothetical protein [Candidatus Tharpella sp.]